MAKAPKRKSAAKSVKSVKSVKKVATAKKSGKKSAAPKAQPKAQPKAAKKAAPKATAKGSSKVTSATKKKSLVQAAPKPASKAAAPKTGKTAPKSSAVDVKASKKSTSAAFASFFTPLDDRVLVERAAVADRTAGGLYLPETVSASERPNQGRVVAVGSGHRDKKGRLRPLDVQLGDTVMYAGFSGSEVRINDQELLVLREKDIIAIVKP